MSEQAWPVVLDVPVHHLPPGSRVPRDALAAVRTAFVPRRIGPADMRVLDVATVYARTNPYRAFEGALWIQAGFPDDPEGTSGEDALRRFLGDARRHEGDRHMRHSLLAGTPLLPLLGKRDTLPGPRPAVADMPTRGILWDGSERVADAAAAQLRDDVLICGDAVFVRNPGPLVAPHAKRMQAMTFNPASAFGGAFMMPLFAPPEEAGRQWERLLPFAAMLPGNQRGDRPPSAFEHLLYEAPCRPEGIPTSLRAPDHDLRATALHGPAWVLGQLARHAGGPGGGAVRGALEPLARLDRTMRFGIADADEVERALRSCRAAIEATRADAGYEAVSRLAFTFAQVLQECMLPRLDRTVPDEDVGALAALGPSA